jgi:peroxiredoxin
MSVEIKASKGIPPSPARRKLRWVLSLLAVALALFGWEVFQVFSAPPLDPSLKALLKWQDVRAPDFSLTDLDGQAIRLADLKGKRVVLNFWATWCPPCVEEIPNFVKLRNATSPTNVVIVGISTDDPASQKAFAKKQGINYPLALLQNVPSPYQDVNLIPVTMFIDGKGVIQHMLFGPQNFKTLKKYATEPDFSGMVKPAPIAE